MEKLKIQLEEINRLIKEAEAKRDKCNENLKKAYELQNAKFIRDCEDSKALANRILRELRATKKYIMGKIAEYSKPEISHHNIESPVAEVSRLLIENFEISSNTFGTVNSEVIANILKTNLSTDRIHKAILDNFNGVKFRKQNGGYTYTLRRRDTANLKD